MGPMLAQGRSVPGSSAMRSKGKATDCLAGPCPRRGARTQSLATRSSCGAQCRPERQGSSTSPVEDTRRWGSGSAFSLSTSTGSLEGTKGEKGPWTASLETSGGLECTGMCENGAPSANSAERNEEPPGCRPGRGQSSTVVRSESCSSTLSRAGTSRCSRVFVALVVGHG